MAASAAAPEPKSRESAPPPARVAIKFIDAPPSAGEIAPRAISDAFEQLYVLAERYLNSVVAGRACLIGGTRGAGKTFTVDAVLEQLSLEWSDRKRPLRVRIHGPSLVRSEGLAEKAKAGDPGDAKPALMSHALTILAIGLYQSLADEFAAQYRNRAMHAVEMNRIPHPFFGQRLRLAYSGSELIEMAHQFRIELDGAPSLAELRTWFNRIGCLHKGVLFDNPQDVEQGFKELVALSTAAEAYRTCIGKQQRQITDTTGSAREESIKREASVRSKELMAPVLTVGAGVASGWAVGLQTDNPILGAFIGIAVAVASAWTVTRTVSSSRTQSAKQEVTFLPDTSAASLVHRLPLLIDRLFSAGIAPIFVVDELDKLEKLEAGRLNEIATYLKFLCADQAFFCYLTNRDYFETVNRQLRIEPFGQQHTAYTDRMVVHHAPDALHAYLKQVLNVEGEGPDRDRFIADLPFVRYLFLHRSCLLPFDLKRSLRECQHPDNSLRIRPGDVRSGPAMQFPVLLQLAVEAALRDRQLSQRMSEQGFCQFVYDALYYPSREWKRSADLDLSEEAVLKEIGGGKANLSDEDFELIYKQVVQMVELIADQTQLKARLKFLLDNKRIELEPDIFGALPLPQLLERKPDTKAIWQWRYGPFGNSLVDNPIEDIVYHPEFDAAGDRITGFTDAIEKLKAQWQESADFNLDTLAERYNLLPKTVTWSSAKSALDRLLEARRTLTPYDDMTSHFDIVKTYSNLLAESAQTLGEAILAAAELSRYDRVADNAKRLQPGLHTLNNGLALYGLDPAATAAAIERTARQLVSDVPVFSPDPALWLTGLQTAMEATAAGQAADARQREEARQRAWQFWKASLIQAARGIRRFDADPNDLRCLAAQDWPAVAFHYDLSAIRAWEWTLILARSLFPAIGPEACPMWAAVPAAEMLGFTGPHRWTIRPGEEAEVQELSDAWYAGRASGSKPAVLILTDSRSAPTNWRVPQHCAAVVTIQDAPLQGIPEPVNFVRSLNIQHLLVNANAPEEELRQLITRPAYTALPEGEMRELFKDKQCAWVIRRAPPRLEGAQRYVTEPKDIDDAFQRAFGSPDKNPA